MAGTSRSAARPPPIPVLMPLLIGLGVEELSVAPASIPNARARLTELDLAQCRALAVRALAASSVAEVQAIAAEATSGAEGSTVSAARARSGRRGVHRRADSTPELDAFARHRSSVSLSPGLLRRAAGPP